MIARLLRPFTTLSAIACALCISLSVSAEDIYLWYEVDENGDKKPHYGETPPPGVKATKIKGYKGPVTPSSSASAADEQAQESTEDVQAQMKKQRQEQCDQERARLKTLQTSGARIRMGDRYLTVEEVMAEIKASEQFIQEACN
jgi:hypothetical protein